MKKSILLICLYLLSNLANAEQSKADELIECAAVFAWIHVYTSCPENDTKCLEKESRVRELSRIYLGAAAVLSNTEYSINKLKSDLKLLKRKHYKNIEKARLSDIPNEVIRCSQITELGNMFADDIKLILEKK